MNLCIDNLFFDYKSKKTLNSITFHVEQNEILSVLGPNGAGKTTLLKCMNRILKPKKGVIALHGNNILQYSQKSIAQNFSYVAQYFEENKLTVFDTILMGRKPYIQCSVSETDLKIVQSIIEKLHLEPIAFRFTEEISGGELQKVSIARALVQNPSVLLMDEPVSSLDLKNQLEILKLIREISTSHPISTIMTMHDINTALRYSDKLLFLKKGEVYAAIKPSDITADMIEEVYDVKVNIHEFHDFHHIFPV